LGGALRLFASQFFREHPLYALGLLTLFIGLAPFYYQIWHIHRAAPVVHAKRILVTRAVAVHGLFWLLVSGFMFTVAGTLLALQTLLAAPWATWGREHAQDLSWTMVVGSAGLSLLLIYALPFWPTRHDARRALSGWMARLRTRF
jgi:hypothetical protein